MFQPADIAQRYNLKPELVKGKTEWHGANPFESGAGENGFILNADGTAWDRTLEKKYTSWEIAKCAGLEPTSYEPCAAYIERNGGTPPRAPKRDDQPKAPKVYNTKTLVQRGYLPATLGHFGVTQRTDPVLGMYWDYPTKFPDGVAGRGRRKWADPSKQLEKWPEKNPAKYWWHKDKEGIGQPDGYNLNALFEKDGQVRNLWIVNGEPSVWACHQEGVLAVSPLGEQRNLPGFLDALVSMGVQEAHYVPDNDPAGEKASQKVFELGKDRGIKIVLHAWHLPPEALNKGYDICDYWDECRAAKKPLGPALLGLPLRKTEKPERAPKAEPKSESASGKQDQTTRLFNLMEEMGMELFHTSDKEAFVSIQDPRGPETVPINSSAFLYLVDELWTANETGTLKKEAIETTARLLTGRALRKGNCLDVSPRVQGRGMGQSQRIYLDLCNKEGQMVEIFAGGWRLIQYAEGIHFRRPPGMKPLPVPVTKEGDDAEEVWDRFKELMGCGSEKNFIVMVSWLLGCMRPADAPYPALAVSGEQDSGKTEKTKMLRQLIDPNQQELADKPENPRDLAISAKNRLVLGYDNLSGIPSWLSDAFCRIATSGCFATRKLHTNDEEMLFQATRPLLLNGIEDFMGRPDFQRRCLFVQLPRFGRDGGSKKKSVREVWKIFADIAPSILGLLCTAAGAAIENSEDESLEDVDPGGGMFDFAQWICAAELAGALPWGRGEFLVAYDESQQVAATSGMDAVLPAAFARFARYLKNRGHKDWSGTASDLWEALSPHAAVILIGEKIFDESHESDRSRLMEKGRELMRKTKDFPANAVHLSRELRRSAQRLRANHIFDCTFAHGSSRIISLSVMNPVPTQEPVLPMDDHDPFEDEE